MFRAECEIREVFRRNEVERRLHETGFKIDRLPNADGSSPNRKKGPLAIMDNPKKKQGWQERRAQKANAANVAAAAAGDTPAWDYSKNTWIQKSDKVPSGFGAAGPAAKKDPKKKVKGNGGGCSDTGGSCTGGSARSGGPVKVVAKRKAMMPEVIA